MLHLEVKYDFFHMQRQFGIRFRDKIFWDQNENSPLKSVMRSDKSLVSRGASNDTAIHIWEKLVLLLPELTKLSSTHSGSYAPVVSLENMEAIGISGDRAWRNAFAATAAISLIPNIILFAIPTSALTKGNNGGIRLQHVLLCFAAGALLGTLVVIVKFL